MSLKAAHRPRVARGGWLLAAALACGSAHAGRPLVTEDAGVLERGDCEFEAIGSRLSVSGASARTAQLQLSCGVGLQTQIQGSLAATSLEGDRSTQAAVSAKTSLRELTDEQAGFTLAYSFAGSKPTDLGWRYDLTTLFGVVTVPVRKDLLLHGNLGASYSRVERQTSAIWAGAVEWLRIAESAFDAMVESFGTQRDPLWLNLGIRYTVVPERFSVNVSYGAQGGSERAKLATLGFKLNF